MPACTAAEIGFDRQSQRRSGVWLPWSGVPLPCSETEPLRSIAAGSPILFSPLDERAMEAALHRLIDEEFGLPIAAGQKRAAQFTWRRASEQTIDALRPYSFLLSPLCDVPKSNR